MVSYSFLLFIASIAGVSALASVNPAIKAAASGMNLLRPIFSSEAKIQAAVLGRNVDASAIDAELSAEKKANKALMYTYKLSPFSTEAVSILESSGYEFTNIELGVQFFLLGGAESVKRVALSKEVEDGATSLPKIFIGGQCVGGLVELASLAESGELDTLMKKARVGKKGQKQSFSLF